jgi:hypothetical protein
MPSTPDSSPSGDRSGPPDGSRQGRPLPRRAGWIVIAATVVVAIALASWRGRIPGRGATLDASISLVTTDRDDLACASPDAFGPYRCGFRAPGKAWPEPPPRADLLAAYYTVNQQLLIVPGLFEQPAVAARYAVEAPRGLPRDLRPRFVASCRFELVGELRHFQTRWLRTGGFNPQDRAWVAVPSDCRVR